MKTLKEILTSLNIDEEIIASTADMELYSKEELGEIKNEYEAKLQNSEINRVVENALIKSGAKNNLAVKALLNLENPKLEKGTIRGLSEQIQKIKNENSYLFSDINTITAGNHNSFCADDYNTMSDEQYYSIKYGKEN